MKCSPEMENQIREQILSELQSKMDEAIGDMMGKKPDVLGEEFMPSGEPELKDPSINAMVVSAGMPEEMAEDDSDDEDDEYPGSRFMGKMKASKKKKMMMG